MNVLLFALALAHGAIDVCRGQLDAAVVDGTHCLSPAHDALLLDGAAVVADATPAPEPLLRDPAIFPAELAFISTVLAIAGGALVGGAYLRDPARLSANEAAIRQGVLIGGVGVVSVSGLVGAAALSSWVFDPSTASLRLPIFGNEP